jgi:hypothetical protein
MLLELTAVTTPMKSSIVSTLPAGIPTRGVVVAVHNIWQVEIHRNPVGGGDGILEIEVQSNPLILIFRQRESKVHLNSCCRAGWHGTNRPIHAGADRYARCVDEQLLCVGSADSHGRADGPRAAQQEWPRRSRVQLRVVRTTFGWPW